jgi:hypothetical protein
MTGGGSDQGRRGINHKRSGAASRIAIARERRHGPQDAISDLALTIGGDTMPEGILCNKQVVDTKEKLNALLADKSGKQYYEEMKALDVDSKALVGHAGKDLQVQTANLAGDLRPLRDVRRQLLFLPGQQQGSQAGALLQNPVHPR